MAIEQFNGENYFLSNTYMLENWIKSSDGLVVPAVEHGYQAQKFVDHRIQEEIALTPNGAEAHKLAHKLIEDDKIEKHPDFDNVEHKIEIMRYWIRQKFTSNLGLGDKLVATGDMLLIQGNIWNDRFWGVDPPGSSDGQNHLGRLLMEQRSELQQARKG